MESYRHATYRYSTGHGFNPNVDVPKESEDVASYKMDALYHNLGRPTFSVNLKREADRVSMQVEEGFQQMKVLGYDSKAGKKYRKLKARLDLIKHLMMNYPIKYIIQKDLEKLYKLYERNSPGMDNVIQKIVDANKGVGGVADYIGVASRVRKGYPLYDQFGRRLTKDERKKFEAKKGKDLSGFGEETKGSLLRLVGLIIIASALLKWSSK